MKKSINGFTLWEIIVVMAIMVILAKIGIPALANITQQKRSEVIATTIADGFRYARSEALRRNQAIYVCGAFIKVDGVLYGCVNSQDWSGGMLSFIDPSNQGLYASGNRVKLNKFESSSASIVKVTAPSKIFKVDARSVISQLNDSSSKKTFCFEIKQRINGKEVLSRLMLDSYGNSTYCKPENIEKCSC